MEWKQEVMNSTPKDLFQLKGETPYFATKGQQPDISHICTFGFYEWVYFREKKAKFPYASQQLGRFLGPAKNQGNKLTYWILKANGYIVPRCSM